MAEEGSDPGFSFVDRRRRGSDPEPAAPERAAPAPVAPAPPPAPAPADLGEGAPLRPDLASLCMMLSTDALVHLGQVPDPLTGQPAPNLEQARFVIDLLAMLKAKTEGNRLAEESALLEEILTSLRMAFVHLTRPR